MADCHDLFLQYHEKIRLPKSKSEDLRRARDGIRGRIKNYFRNTLEQSVPDFKMQGSFAIAMKTMVNPLSGEYDVDDGVYLTSLDADKKNWPIPSTVHRWIYDAVDGHTIEKPTDKRTCVRVTYAGNYHVDLPIYGTHEEAKYLAEKGDRDWHVSEPGKFTYWFIGEVTDNGEQLRRIVRYIKAWTDYDSRLGKMPSSIVLTVLTTNNYISMERDDACFARVVSNICDDISGSFIVPNPVDGAEDLAERLTAGQKEHFGERITVLLDSATQALQEDDKEKACKKWRKQFGDRFPACEGLKDHSVALKTSSPAILRDDARSA